MKLLSKKKTIITAVMLIALNPALGLACGDLDIACLRRAVKSARTQVNQRVAQVQAAQVKVQAANAQVLSARGQITDLIGASEKATQDLRATSLQRANDVESLLEKHVSLRASLRSQQDVVNNVYQEYSTFMEMHRNALASANNLKELSKLIVENEIGFWSFRKAYKKVRGELSLEQNEVLESMWSETKGGLWANTVTTKYVADSVEVFLAGSSDEVLLALDASIEDMRRFTQNQVLVNDRYIAKLKQIQKSYSVMAGQ